MGATCSACCCNDRRDSDVVLADDDGLQQKLLEYDHEGGENGTMLTDDSRGNPFSHSDSRLKASWPRPATTPTSVYDDYEIHHDDDDEDDGDTDQSGYGDRSDTTSEHDSRHSSSSAAHSPSVQLAWNLREGGDSFVASSELLNDGDVGDRESSAMGSAMRSDRTLSTAQSVRSAASDSYASNRELPTYESLLFADDAAAKSHDADEKDDDDDDQGDGDSNSTFSDRQLSSSSFAESSSAIDMQCATANKAHEPY